LSVRQPPQSPVTAPSEVADRRRVARRAVQFAGVGIVLGLIGPVLDAIGGVTGAAALIVVGIVVQAAALAFILGGVIVGFIALTRGARPRTLPVLAIAALPVSGVLILVEVFVIFVVTT